MNNLASAYWSVNRLEKSIPLLEESLALRRSRSGEDHPETVLVKANLGVNYRDAGRLPESLRLLEEANRAVPRYPALRWVHGRLLDTYVKAGKNDLAAALANEMLTSDRAMYPADSPRLAELLDQVGSYMLASKRWTEAVMILREALTIREGKEPNDWKTFNTKSLLGGALLGQKSYESAAPLLRGAYEGMMRKADKIPPRSKAQLGDTLDRLIELAEATGNAQDAKMLKDERAKVPSAATPMHARSETERAHP